MIRTTHKPVAGVLAALMALIFTITPATPATPALAQAPDPRAQIAVPGTDQTVRGTVNIQGTASMDNFSRYELSYAAEPDAVNWVSLGGAVQPVTAGTLGVWNTRPLPDGNYALRLQVFDAAGGLAETTVRNIVLANAVAAPAPETGAAVTTTAGTSAGVVTEMQTARNTLEVITDTIGELPGAFVQGARIAVLGFLALGAYVLLKKVLAFALHRLTRRPIDYGR
jgi:hypothetical protein